jgi:magnesium chelatase family protein
VQRYRERISGPLLDRIDLHIEMEAVTDADLERGSPSEASRPVRERAVNARERQVARQGVANARVPASQIDERMRPDTQGRQLMRHAGARLGLSARAHHRVLRVARTIADLDGSPTVRCAHVAEALHYRGLRPLPAA